MKRRDFLRLAGLTGASALLPAPLMAMGGEDRFAMAQLRYGSSGWNPRPTAVRRLLLEVEKRTSILVDSQPPSLAPSDPEIYTQPFLVLAGDRKFDPLSEKAVLNLRAHLQAGGFLLVDSAEGVEDGPFLQSVRRELKRILPGKTLGPVPRDHVVYKSFFLIDEPVGRLRVRSTMDGIFDEDRLAVAVSHNDLLGAWSRDNFGNWTYECTPGGERQREMAYRMGINLVMYALCINYKADQVHVPFILKRRQWKVE